MQAAAALRRQCSCPWSSQVAGRCFCSSGGCLGGAGGNRRATFARLGGATDKRSRDSSACSARPRRANTAAPRFLRWVRWGFAEPLGCVECLDTTRAPDRPVQSAPPCLGCAIVVCTSVRPWADVVFSYMHGSLCLGRATSSCSGDLDMGSIPRSSATEIELLIPRSMHFGPVGRQTSRIANAGGVDQRPNTIGLSAP